LLLIIRDFILLISMIRVLFVCMGNICRSPMAEAVFQHMVREADLESDIEADSAGTGDWHVDSPAHPGTLEILRRNNIPYEGRARCLQPSDLTDWDYLITMDNQNLRHVERLRKIAGTQTRIVPLLDFATKNQRLREVPDPYFDGGFARVFDLVQDGCAGLLASIRREHNL
jgi:protein-tyrosine phosphatase